MWMASDLCIAHNVLHEAITTFLPYVTTSQPLSIGHDTFLYSSELPHIWMSSPAREDESHDRKLVYICYL